MKAKFRRHKCDSCESECGSCGTCGGCADGSCGSTPIASPVIVPQPKGESIPAPKAKEMPKGQVLAPVPAEMETHNPFELHRRYETRVGHGPDFSWLTGQLFFVHADGGLWILRYAPLDNEDANGGSVVLARDVRMDNYREGDLVTIHGGVVNQKSSTYVGGPLYRASSIELLEREAK